MPGPAIPKQPVATPLPQWLQPDYLNPENASVFDSPVKKAARAVAGLLGVGDVQGQAMNLAGPLMAAETPLGPLANKAVSGIKGLYSRAQRVASGLPEKFHPNKALAALKNMASGEELGYRGVEPYLRSQGNVGTKTGLLEHLEKNPTPQLEVKTLGEPAFADPRYTAGGPPETPTKYQQYQVPGGENYQETLIKLRPEIPKSATGVEMPYEQWRESKPDFQSSHWDDPNVLAHVRSNERYLPASDPALDIPPNIRDTFLNLGEAHAIEAGATGDDILRLQNEIDTRNLSKGRFLEEVQSDWHQQGAKEGYQTSGLPPGYTVTQTPEGYFDVRAPNGQLVQSGLTEETAIETAVEHLNTSRVPDAPFKQSWPDLALKQQLLDVAERPDLEWIGHTTGATQADRYNLANHVDRLYYDYNPGRGWDIEGYQGGQRNTVTGWVPDNQLEQWIGPDAAQALRTHRDTNTLSASGLGSVAGPTSGSVDVTTTLQGQGNRGLTQFYDQTLPNKLRKLLEPFGGKVELEKLSIPSRIIGGQLAEAPNQGQLQAWIARLSPEMKKAILEKGFPIMALYALMNPGAQPVDPQLALDGLAAQ